MNNLKKEKGSYKGIIGECMFLMTNKKLVSRILYRKNLFLDNFSKYLTQEQINFFKKNYYSIDAVNVENGVTIYEIKTENYYPSYLGYKPKTTKSIYQIFKEAQFIGIKTKLIIVKLFDNWEFDIREFNFKKSLICIDRPKQYDKR